MKRSHTLLPLLLAATAAQAQGVKWQSDLATAQKLAKKQKKMLLVDFMAPW